MGEIFLQKSNDCLAAFHGGVAHDHGHYHLSHVQMSLTILTIFAQANCIPRPEAKHAEKLNHGSGLPETIQIQNQGRNDEQENVQ